MASQQRPESERAPHRLLHTARVLFSKRGYNGVSVRALARAARVDLGAVRYHFGSKEGLYREVLRTSLDPLRDRLEDLLCAGLPAPAQLRSGLAEAVEFLHADPWAALLVQRRFLEVQAWPAGEADALVTLPALVRMIEGGQEAGVAHHGEPHTLALRFLLLASQMALICRAASSCPAPSGRGMEGRLDSWGSAFAGLLILNDDAWQPKSRTDISGPSGRRGTP